MAISPSIKLNKELKLNAAILNCLFPPCICSFTGWKGSQWSTYALVFCILAEESQWNKISLFSLQRWSSLTRFPHWSIHTPKLISKSQMCSFFTNPYGNQAIQSSCSWAEPVYPLLSEREGSMDYVFTVEVTPINSLYELNADFLTARKLRQQTQDLQNHPWCVKPFFLTISRLYWKLRFCIETTSLPSQLWLILIPRETSWTTTQLIYFISNSLTQ